MIADAAPDNWVDRFAPPLLRPFLKLARADRPIGTWLLFWPCAWGAAFGAPVWPNFWHIVLFGIGAIAMRGAGCTFNDIVDRDIDTKVARTARRPLASGAVSLPAAIAFLIFEALIGLVVLLQFNGTAIALGCASLILVAIYPFMKRITWWPQLFLGLAFNWGVLMGVAAAGGALGLKMLLIYGAGICWTLGYDTIYALQDREDDALIGVKSTARLFGAHNRAAIAGFYAAMIAALTLAGADFGLSFFLCLSAVAAHLAWQVIALRPDDSANCLMLFRSNRWTGLLVFIAFLLGRLAG